MKIREILTLYTRHPCVRQIAERLSAGDNSPIDVSGLPPSAAAMVIATLADKYGKVMRSPWVVIAEDEDAAGYMYHDLTQVLDADTVLFFPSSFKRAVKYGQRDAGNGILRTEALSSFASGRTPLIAVTYPQALAEKTVAKSVLSEKTLRLCKGEKVDVMFVQETLADYGFVRTDYVYEPGQYSVRGSIIDVYSYSHELPYRIDFFGDEVDSIRTFEVETQLSTERLESISIVPEMKAGDGESTSLLSFIPQDSVLVMRDSTYIADSVRRIWDDGFSFQAQKESESDTQTLVKEDTLVDPSVFERQMAGFRHVRVSPTVRDNDGGICFSIHPQPSFHKNLELLKSSFSSYLKDGMRLYILADSAKQTERLKNIFEDGGSDITFTPVDKTLHEGYADDTLKACFFTDHQIFDRFHKYSLRSECTHNGKVALTLKELQQFDVGDYVVHIDHGVGRFGGLVRIPCGDKMQEVIKIIYNNDDTIFVSINSLHKVSKYKGKEGEPPRVSTLGTGAWEKMKERTKTKIKDIARDLIKLYAERRREKGFMFSKDSFMQHELEASFLYEDTPDQLKATQDVKADMESGRPMDRLVCGDVGFGKTEVAIRAAFKACADNKQVAVLVPTTVLAYQHFRTFSERLSRFPVKVDYLTRARPAAETRRILQELKSGETNIVVGTHRLVSKTVHFHDLGLLIIDEEQKFGVSTKERLRQMKSNVDTLTLTATPIPRTLQFSLMGARDLSVIQTPPPNRRPIQTQITTFSAEVITEAIGFEMSRGGQVFFINNRIGRLYELADMIRKYVPDARVAVGHGQMPAEELENVMLGFAHYDYDVLVSTTIIESGLDIPNANTIIINGAHNFGLSDLHQMRGRVGRSHRKAFCYLLAPPLASLNAESRRRLQAVEEFSDLGSGIHIAMQDLDIRGAGNMLGAEQSGFIADLGYETYQKILSQAVSELRNDEFGQLYGEEAKTSDLAGSFDYVDECVVESDIPMSFSEEYVPTCSERMLLYRELDGLEKEEDVEMFRHRMKDRFGDIPPEGEELIRVVALRRMGKLFACERIVLKNGKMRMYFVSSADSPFYQSGVFGQIITFVTSFPHISRLEEKNGKRSMLVSEVPTVESAMTVFDRIGTLKSE